MIRVLTIWEYPRAMIRRNGHNVTQWALSTHWTLFNAVDINQHIGHYLTQWTLINTVGIIQASLLTCVTTGLLRGILDLVSSPAEQLFSSHWTCFINRLCCCNLVLSHLICTNYISMLYIELSALYWTITNIWKWISMINFKHSQGSWDISNRTVWTATHNEP